MPSVLKDRFLSLNSHIFFFVVDQCQCRQRQASKTADICSAFEPQLPAEIIDVYKLTNFIQSSLAANAFISCPNELRTRKCIYVRFQLLSYLFSSKYSRRSTLSRSRQRQAIQLWLHLQKFKTPFIYRRNRSFVKSTSGFARSHSRFTFDHGSRIFHSLLTKNQSAIC